MRAPQLLLSLLVLLLLAAAGWFVLRDDAAGGPADEALTQAIARDEGVTPDAGTLPATPLAEPAEAGPGSEAGAERVELAEAPPAAAEEERRTRRLRGRVVDSLGAPLADARVFVARGRGFGSERIDLLPEDAPFTRVERATTDDRGEYVLDTAWRGELRLAARAKGYAPLRVTRHVEGGDEASVADLVLERGGLLSGHVVDAAGNGVEGVSFEALETSTTSGIRVDFASGSAQPLATSGPGGAFVVDELAVGPFELQLRHPEHPDLFVTGEVERSGEAQGDLRYVLEDGLRISGLARGVPAGEEAGYLVRARPAEDPGFDGPEGLAAYRMAPVGPGGDFLLRGLRAGDYLLHLVEADSDLQLFAQPQSTGVVAEAGASGVELDLRPPCSLTFRVLDAESGEPLSDFRCKAGRHWMQVLEAAEAELEPGMALYEDVPLDAGRTSVALRVEAEGYESLDLPDVELAPGERTDLGDLRLQRVPTISVLVVADATGEPIERARVRLEEVRPELGPGERRVSMSLDLDVDDHPEVPGFESRDQSSGRTDEEGRVELPSLPGKTCRLSVRARGFADYKGVAIELPTNGGLELEARLLEGGQVVVQVLDADGEPKSGARVEQRLLDEGGNTRVIGGPGGRRTNSKGIVEFDHLPAGTHRFELAEAGPGMVLEGGDQVILAGFGRDEPATGGVDVLVSEGSVSEITLHAAPEGTLRGRVTESGEPLSGATLSFEKDTGAPAGGPAGMAMGMPGFDSGPSARTDGRGEYEIEGLQVGDYDVTITHPSRAMPAEARIQVREGTGSEDFDLSIAILEGRVLDSQGEPAAGVRVTPKRYEEPGVRRTSVMRMVVADGGGGAMSFTMGEQEGEPARTDAEGRYQLRGVTPDVEIYVETAHDSFQEARSEPVTVGADQTRRGLDIEVFEAGSVELVVVDGAGDPMSFCLLDLEYRGASEEPVDPETTFVGEGGRAKVASLRPGRWSASGRTISMGMSPGGGSEDTREAPPVEFEVRPGETVEALVTFD